jgi:SAM-dependent methyltransferase
MPGYETIPSGPNREPYVAFGNVEARNGLQSRFEIPLMLRLLGPPQGSRVLEIGCGRGVALPVLAALLAPSSLVGLDIDPELIAIADELVRTNAVPARVMSGDARALPFDTGSFDLVIDFGTCYHVGGGIDGARAALREVARVLRPGGLFVHETPVAQQLAHPVRSFGRRLPWKNVPELKPYQQAVLWAMRRKQQRD